MSMDIDNEELTEFIKNELKMFKPLQKREEDTIIRIMLDEKMEKRIRMLSRNRLIMGYSRFVYAIAKIKAVKNGKSVADLYQAGISGMLKCAPNYDPNKVVNGKKAKFYSYAVWWIVQAMNEEIYKANDAVHVPMYGKEVMKKKFRENNLDTSEYRSVCFLNATAPVVSTYSQISSHGHSMEDSGMIVEDLIVEMEDSHSRIISKNEDVKLGEMLQAVCSPEDYKLIKDTYFHNQTLVQIGESIGVGGERARQKKNRAVLRAQTALKKLMKEKNFQYTNMPEEMDLEVMFNPKKYK